MPFEIERKFLVTGEFRDQAYNCTHIRQGYICSGYLTIKGPSGEEGLKRYEFEQEISLSDAEDLMTICKPGIIDKNRYLVRCGKHVFEVDEFFGENEGLVIAEVELQSEDEAFEKPDFIGREVTGDRRFYNAHMRKNPFFLWKDDIKDVL